MGRPRIILDESLIERFIGRGYTVEYVADYFDVNPDTLYANYSESLRKGRVFRNSCLQAKQLQTAMKGDRTMLIWLGKQWLGQKDQIETTEKREPLPIGLIPHEPTGKDSTRVC